MAITGYAPLMKKPPQVPAAAEISNKNGDNQRDEGQLLRQQARSEEEDEEINPHNPQ
jgi:hypothetical protein